MLVDVTAPMSNRPAGEAGALAVTHAVWAPAPAAAATSPHTKAKAIHVDRFGQILVI